MESSNYWKKRRDKRKAELFQLLGGKCSKCGSKNNLQFDHIDPKTKSYHVLDQNHLFDQNIQSEIDKCQLLCKDCHKQKTKDGWEYALPESSHGSLWRYKKYKCRCDKCKKALSDYYYNKKD